MNSNKAIYFLILAIFVALIAITFSLQNSQVVELKLLGFSFKQTLAFVLLVFFGLGALLTILLMMPKLIAHSSKVSKQNKRILELEEIRADLESQLEEIQVKANELKTKYLEALPPAEREKILELEQANQEEKKKGFWSFLKL